MTRKERIAQLEAEVARLTRERDEAREALVRVIQTPPPMTYMGPIGTDWTDVLVVTQ